MTWTWTMKSFTFLQDCNEGNNHLYNISVNFYLVDSFKFSNLYSIQLIYCFPPNEFPERKEISISCRKIIVLSSHILFVGTKCCSVVQCLRWRRHFQSENSGMSRTKWFELSDSMRRKCPETGNLFDDNIRKLIKFQFSLSYARSFLIPMQQPILISNVTTFNVHIKVKFESKTFRNAFILQQRVGFGFAWRMSSWKTILKFIRRWHDIYCERRIVENGIQISSFFHKLNIPAW